MVEQRGVAVVGGLAAVGDAVGVVIGQIGEQLVQRLGVTDLVLGDRAGRDVLLEHRRDAGPLGVPEADHELVVGGAENQLGEGVAGGDVERGGRRRHSAASVGGALLRGLQLVLDDVAARLLVAAVEGRLEQVRVVELGDRVARHDPEPMRLAAAAVELAGVVQRQLLVGSVHVAGVDHRVTLVLLAEDLPHALAHRPYGRAYRHANSLAERRRAMVVGRDAQAAAVSRRTPVAPTCAVGPQAPVAPSNASRTHWVSAKFTRGTRGATATPGRGR